MAGAFSSAFNSAFDIASGVVSPGALTLAGTSVRLNLTLTPGAASLGVTGQTPTINAASATFLGSAQGASTDGFSATTAGLDTTGAGALFAFISSQSFVPDPYLTDSKGNQWTRWGQGNAASTGVALTLWYCSPRTVGTGHTLTVTEQGQTFPAIHLLAFACAPILGLVNVASSAGNSGLVSTQAPGSITPSANNAIIVTGFAVGGGIPLSLTGGFTLDQTTALVGSQHYGLGSAHLIQTTAAASNPTWTNNSAQRVASIQAAFLVGQTATNEDRVSQLTLESVSVSSVGDQRTSQLVLESLIPTGATIIPLAALTLTGQTPAISNGRHVGAGALTLAGQTPAAQITVPVGEAVVALTGLAPVLNVSALPGAATLAIAGQTPTLAANTSVPVGALAIVGQTPLKIVNAAVLPGAGAFSLSGQTPAANTAVAVPAGTLTLAGTTSALTDQRVPSAGSLVWTGAAPSLATTFGVPAGALSLNGQAPVNAKGIPVPAGALALAGTSPSLSLLGSVGPGSLVLTGLAPTTGVLIPAIPGAGALTISGQTPTAAVRVATTPGAGALALSGTTASLTVSTQTAPGAGALVLTGRVPTLAITVSGITPGVGALTWSGPSPTSLNNSAVGNLLAQPDTGRLTLRGYVPGQAFTFPLDGTVPVDPPPGSGECTTDVTDEGSGGRGANGCNPGGTGWTSSYAGPWGSVPDHTDLTPGDTIGDGTANLWVEIADGTTETKVAAVWLADAAVVARGGLLASGRVEHALGNEQGGYEVATISLGFFDEQDRLMRSGADDIEGDELRVKLIVEN